LSRATVSRLTQTLLRAGYLEYDPGQRAYRLGAAVLSLGHAMRTGSSVLRVAAPLMRALARLPDVDAVFAANDAHAIGFMAGLRDAGLLRNGPAAEQPVAVIGLGDLEMGRLIAPKLSTVRIHGDAIGRTAAKLTLERNGPRRIDLGFELVLRDSG
jgi:DNA-binding LacI/PurR family transcriptional regulator